MDGNRGVAQDRLGPRGGDADRGIRIDLACRVVNEVVANRPERPGLGLRDDFEVRHARPAAGTPVDERFGPIREPVAIQPLERDSDRLGRPLVHRETEPIPVARRTESALLAEHDLARLVDELPHSLEVPFAAQ
jgi:hypothetical protein